MFQNLRENQQIYVLNNTPTPSISMGTVVKIQGPMQKIQTAPNMIPQTEFVLNIIVSVNGVNRLFPQLPVNKDSAEYVDEQTIIAMSRDAMNAELNSLKTEAMNAIQRGRDEEARFPIWDELILQLNPEVAEKQRQEKEITTLKNQVTQLAQTNLNLENMMARLMDKLDGDGNKSSKKDK